MLNDLYLGASESNVYKANADCRLQLLNTLKALQLNSHPLTPPPTQFSIEMFNMALRDQDVRISQEAKSGLTELEKIVHPSAPTLDFPIQPRDKDEDDQDKETNQLTNTTGISQQRSMNELLDSIRTKQSSEQSNKRALENIEIIPSKLPRTEIRESEPVVSNIANPEFDKSSNRNEQFPDLGKNNREQAIISDNIGAETGDKTSTIKTTSEESLEKSEEMETEIVKESSTENNKKIEENLQSQVVDFEIVDLFVDELQE